MSSVRISRRSRLLAGTTGLATVLAGLATAVAPTAARAIITGEIDSAGPLTTIAISPDLNCSTNRTGDTSGEWFDDTACGTFAVVNGALYGPASVPAGYSATGYETAAWTPVSQVGPTGAGTVASPYTVVTTVRAGATGVTVTETDTYITGQEGYATYIAVGNGSGAAVNLRLYHAGDCYLQDSDKGFGVVDTNTGSAGCQAEVTPEVPADNHVRGTRVEQLFPLTPGSAYMEDHFSDVWAVIGQKQPFANTCKCADADYTDNGVGLSWDTPALAVGQTVQQGVYTSLSPTGIVPATTGNVADATSVIIGHPDAYTVTVRNTGASAIHLVGVNDQLPAGFVYTHGSTTGLTTGDPVITGQTLSWTIPSTVIPAHGSASLHFGFTAANVAGDYINSASGVSTETAVVPAGPFAPLHVITVPAAPTAFSALGARKAVHLSWTPSADIGNSVLTGFDIQVTPAGKPAYVVSLTVGTATSAVIGGLKDNVGYSFVIRAKNAAGAGAWTAPLNVAGSKLVRHKVVSKATYGASRTLKVTLLGGGKPVVGATLKLEVRAASKHRWKLAGRAVTKAGGVASLKVKPARSSVYEWVYAGDATHTGSVTDQAIAVAPWVKIKISSGGHVFKNGVATLTGQVGPAFPHQKAVLQKKVGKRWVFVGTASITGSGRFAFALDTSSRGTTVYRVVKSHKGDYLAGYSASKTLTVS